jgi:outer membrane protein TolC
MKGLAMRSTWWTLLCLAIIYSIPAKLRAQVRELGADESVQLGLEHNARLRIARADAAAADAAYRRVRAARLPSIRSLATYTRLSSNIPGVEFMLPGLDSTFTFQAVQLDRYHAELTLEQPIFTGFRLANESRAASHAADAAALLAQQERADVAFEIRRTYWNLYRANGVRAAVAAAMTQVERLVVDVRDRLAAGTALTRDVLTAQTRQAEVQLERVEAENAVRVGQLELNRMIGLPFDAAVQPTADVTVREPALALDAATAAALAERPQLAALAEQVRARSAELRAAQGQRFPELSFLGRYVYARPNPYFFAAQDEFHGTWELGLSARWSIWEGGRVNAQTAEARARLDAAEARLADAREEVAVDVARRHLEVLRTRAAVDAAAQNVREAEESFRVVQQQFAEGAALSAEVLDAEQALRRAQARRVDALADHAIAHAALLNVIGRVE